MRYIHPSKARGASLIRSRRAPVLYYEGKPAPFPLVLRPHVHGVRGVGSCLAQIWREEA